MPDRNGESLSVGYGHPPQESQYKPGQSGNPGGRPKEPEDLNAKIRDELNIYIPALVNGHEVQLTQKHAVVRALIRKAFAGDPRALGIVLQRYHASHPPQVGRIILQFGDKAWTEPGEEEPSTQNCTDDQ